MYQRKKYLLRSPKAELCQSMRRNKEMKKANKTKNKNKTQKNLQIHLTMLGDQNKLTNKYDLKKRVKTTNRINFRLFSQNGNTIPLLNMI